MMLAILYSLLSFLILWTAGRATATDELPVTAARIGERVLVLTCLGNNVAAIVSGGGVVVIDTHRSPGLMTVMKRMMVEELGRSDFRYVVNTHGHWDHSSGNQAFPEAAIVGHTRCRKFILQSPATTLRLKRARVNRIKELEENPAEDESGAELRVQKMILHDIEDTYTPTPPVETFDDRLTLDAGDVTLELYYAGWAHTDHDVLVYVPEEKLLFTGDLFCSRNGPCFAVDAMTDAPRLASILEEILEREPDEIKVIRGHGEAFGRSDLVVIRDVLLNKAREVDWEGSAARHAAGLLERPGANVSAALEAATDGRYVDEQEFYTLGRRYVGRGKTGLAISVLEFALASFPESALLYDALAEAHLKSGNVELAIRYYEKSLGLASWNRNAEEMLEALRTPDR